jgi:hypothetical protein
MRYRRVAFGLPPYRKSRIRTWATYDRTRAPRSILGGPTCRLSEMKAGVCVSTVSVVGGSGPRESALNIHENLASFCQSATKGSNYSSVGTTPLNSQFVGMMFEQASTETCLALNEVRAPDRSPRGQRADKMVRAARPAFKGRISVEG